MNVRAIRELTQGVHRQFDALDVGRCDSFHLGLGNPARPQQSALAVAHGRFGGDAVPHREFAIVLILQIGHAFVPVVAFQAAKVRPRNERHVAMHFELGLERECFVLCVVRRRSAAIDQEKRHGARSLGNAAVFAIRKNGAYRNRNLEAAAAGDFLLQGLRGLSGDVDFHRLVVGDALPVKEYGLALLRAFRFVIAPAGQDLQLLRLYVD